MKCIGLILLFTFLTACSRSGKVETSATTINVSRMVSALESSGGAIIMGKHLVRGDTFQMQVNGNDMVLELPNGDWEFKAISWSGTDPDTGVFIGPMKGTMYCEHLPFFKISNDLEINLKLTPSKCDGPAFGGPDSRSLGVFKNARFWSCNLLDSIIAGEVEGVTADNPPIFCSEVGGKEHSFRIHIPTFPLSKNPIINSQVGFKSPCIGNISSPGGSVSTNGLILPEFDNDIIIEAFVGDNCTGDVTTHQFSGSMNGTSANGKSIANSTRGERGFFIDSDICTGSFLADTTLGNFAQGAFDASGINYICTAKHLQALDSTVNPGGTDAVDTMVNGTFMIGKDIDLTGHQNLKIFRGPNVFVGYFTGMHYKITNGGTGLFGDLGAGAQIEHLTLQNFDVDPTGTLSGQGILVDHIEAGTVGPGSDVRLHNIRILGGGFTAQGAGSGVGSVVGVVKDTELTLEKFRVDGVSISGDYFGAEDVPTGGLIGRVSLNRDDYQVTLERGEVKNTIVESRRKVGGVIGAVDVDALGFSPHVFVRELSMRNVDVSGKFDTGGVIGNLLSSDGTPSATLVNIQYINGDPNTHKIKGIQRVGGLIGASNAHEFRIAGTHVESKIIADMATAEATYHDFGGLVGLTDMDAEIRSSYADVIMGQSGPSSGSGPANVGGLVGHIANGKVAVVTLGNVHSQIDFDLNSDNMGGLVGFQGNSTGSLSIRSSSAVGTIDQLQDAQADNVGGLIGSASYYDLKNDFAKVYITANLGVGGVIGSSEDQTTSDATAVQYEGNITCSDRCAFFMGSAIQQSASSFDLIVAKGNLTATGGSDYATFLGGSGVLSFDWSCTNILAEGANINNVAVDDTVIGSSYTSATAGSCGDLGTHYQLATEITGTSDELWNTTTDELQFLTQWKNYSPSLTEKGVPHSPFIIDSISDWNYMGAGSIDSPPRPVDFLLEKSYALSVDLDFSNDPSNFYPFGDLANSTGSGFGGVFIPQGHALRNVNISSDAAQYSSVIGELGVFRQVGNLGIGVSGHVGLQDDPLVIEGLEITTIGQGQVGAVGTLDAGTVQVHVRNGQYTLGCDGTAQDFGGIVGLMQGGDIKSSSFQGTIEIGTAATCSYIGGLVGQIMTSGMEVGIETSDTNVEFVGSNGDYIGGIFGFFDRDPQIGFVNFETLYSKVTGMNPALTNTGGFGNIVSTATANVDIRGVLVDLRGTPNSSFDDAVGAFDNFGVNANGDINLIDKLADGTVTHTTALSPSGPVVTGSFLRHANSLQGTVDFDVAYFNFDLPGERVIPYHDPLFPPVP